MRWASEPSDLLAIDRLARFSGHAVTAWRPSLAPYQTMRSSHLQTIMRPPWPRRHHGRFWNLPMAALAGVLAVSALGLAGCAAIALAPPITAADERAVRQMVLELADPAMEGRGAGTGGLDHAREYLVGRFTSLGLEPAFLVDGQASYTQPFEISLGVQVTDQSLVLLADDGQSLAPAHPGGQFNVLGFSASGSFEGRVAFAGYGIVSQEHGYDSYRDLPDEGLRGAVVVAFRYEPQDAEGKSLWAGRDGAPGRWTQSASMLHKAQWAADRGAAALLVVNPPSQDDGGLKSTQHSVAAQSAPIPVLHIRSGLFDQLLRLAGRDPGKVVGAFQRQADAGRGVVEVLKGVVVRGRVSLKVPRASMANVGAVVPGRGQLARETVVVGAHYDHLGYGQIGSLSQVQAIHPGADDNASGVAGLLLLAQRLSVRNGAAAGVWDTQQPDPDAPRRSVLLVAFSGEERGLLGSGHLLKHLNELSIPSAQPVAMLNFDMIGRMRDRKLQVIGLGSGDGWKSLLEQAATDRGLDLKQHDESFGGSDHMSFLVRQVPALHFFTGSHRDYHRTSDTADKVNPVGVVRTVDLTQAMVAGLLWQPRRMAFTGTAEGLSRAVAMAGQVVAEEGDRVYLGVMPDYATMDGQDGCGLSGVMPGSPAMAAGLRADDVIVFWDGQPVANVRALSDMLRGSHPSQEIELGIRRNGQVIRLRVMLGRRSG